MIGRGASFRCILQQKRPVFGWRLAHPYLSCIRPFDFSTNPCLSYSSSFAARPRSQVKDEVGPLVSCFPYLPFTTNQRCSSEEQKVQVVPENLNAKRETIGDRFWELRGKLASPVLQVFSIDIRSANDIIVDPLEIYGSILATDYQGTTSFLYNRDFEDPEVITLPDHGNLSLIGSSSSFITRSLDTTTTLEYNLKDKVRGIDVLKGKLELHSKCQEIENSCDKLCNFAMKGKYVTAFGYYTTFRFAVLAIVTVKVSERHDNASSSTSEDMVDVYGSIFGTYPNARQYCNKDSDVKHMMTTLFNQRSDNYVRTRVADPIKLSRCAVAVPVYSSLEIAVDLWDSRGELARGSVKFPANDGSPEWIDGGGARIEVQVEWHSPFDRRFKSRIKQMGIDHHVNFSPFGKVPPPAITSVPSCFDLVEVFSAYVSGFNHEVSALCGTIKYTKSVFFPSMYERDLSHPEILGADNPIPSIVTDTAINSDRFAMFVDLHDPVQDLHLGTGYISHGFNVPTWLSDVRLCSIIPGKHGYTAVHYMCFEEGCRAYVDIRVLPNGIAPGTTVSVNGTVVACYSTHDYSTGYQKKYFQSRLFNSPSVESVKLKKPHSYLPLLKSVVVVPCDASLIIEADLRVISSANPEGEAVCGIISFDTDDFSCISSKIIRGEQCNFQVYVEFEGKFQIYSREMMQIGEAWHSKSKHEARVGEGWRPRRGFGDSLCH